MKKVKINDILKILLIISLFFNLYFIYSSYSLKRKEFCSKFKDQVADRIRTYYTDGDIDNIYPDEIFYSRSKSSCIALWSGHQNNPAGNGYSITNVVFDAISNENIYSDTLYYFDDGKLKEENVLYNNQKIEYYRNLLKDLR